jgi:hypothetical protein
VIILVLTVDQIYLTNFDIMQNKMKLKSTIDLAQNYPDPDELMLRQVKNACSYVTPQIPSNPN